MSAIRIEVQGEARFLAMREQWSELLARSDADPLFGSWDWLSTWWHHHRDDFRLEARLLLAHEGERLVGIAPLLLHRVVHRGLIPARRCELIGNLWRNNAGVMSERTGFIVDSSRPDVHQLLAREVLATPGWSDFMLVYADVAGPTSRALLAAARQAGAFSRIVDPLTAYHISLDGGFDALLPRLSSRARRRLFNERRKLDQLGGACWESACAETADEFWTDLDRVHSVRWGWRATAGRRGRMYRDFCNSRWTAGSPVLRRLRVGGRTIAAMHGYRIGDRIYEIQNAIESGFSKSISPGYLQAGYLLEEAAASGVSVVDLLGGQGRSTDYKAQLGSTETQLGCLQVVRAPWLKLFYRGYSLVKG